MDLNKIRKLRIVLRAYSSEILVEACSTIREAVQEIEPVKYYSDLIAGPVPLPTKRRIYCVLRSPHVNKDSREHFEIRIHKRFIDIGYPSNQTVKALKQLYLPFGVDIELKAL